MKRIFTTENVTIFSFLCLSFVCVVCGLVLGLRIGYTNGTRHTTEIRNQMLDIQPYDANLKIINLEYSDISPSGFIIHFDTLKTTGNTIYGNDVHDLACEWTVYPSDIFTITPIGIRAFERPSLMAKIETYPEGGTVMFRIIAEKRNYGSLWFYIDLPRPENAILPPPYMPKKENE